MAKPTLTGLVQWQNTQSGNPRKGLKFRTLSANGGVIHRYTDGLEVFVPKGHAGLGSEHVSASSGLQQQTVQSGGVGPPAPKSYAAAVSKIKPPRARYSGNTSVSPSQSRRVR